MSNHGDKRIRERVSVSKRQKELALERGKIYTTYTGSFRRYLDKVHYKNDTSAIVYGNNIYLFGKCNVLVTVLTIPSNYKNILRNQKFRKSIYEKYSYDYK